MLPHSSLSFRPIPLYNYSTLQLYKMGRHDNTVVTGKPVDLVIEYEVLQETEGLRVFFVLYDAEGTSLFRSFAHGDAEQLPVMRPGRYVSCATIPQDFLAPITYEIGVSASIYNVRRCFAEDIIIVLSVQDAGRIKYAYAHYGKIGVKLAPLIPWTTVSYP